MRLISVAWCLGLCSVLFATGCGMEAVDTRIQARSESAIDLPTLEITEERLCPNLVTISNQPFDPAGSVEGQFGPFVPCNTPISADGECPSCGWKVRMTGAAPSFEGAGEPGPTLAVPRLVCPYCKQTVDPAAVLGKNQSKSRLGLSVCPNPKCEKNFIVVARDELVSVDIPEETFCPSCQTPVDPTLNACTNPSCKLGGVIRVVLDFVGPCWRCGGTKVCPNCGGAGLGSRKVFGQTPATCWYCEDTGECPECDEDGFTLYEGALPPTYVAWSKGSREQAPQPYAQSKRKWKFSHDAGAGDDGASEE